MHQVAGQQYYKPLTMALRHKHQQQIDNTPTTQQQQQQHHQLLAAKEQRMRYLQVLGMREAAELAEGERLRRLRERVDEQESKLRRLRAMRGQVDLQKTYNVTLSKYNYCSLGLSICVYVATFTMLYSIFNIIIRQ